MPDLNAREWAAIVPLVLLMVWMGVFSQSFLPSVSATNSRILAGSKISVETQVKNPAGVLASLEGLFRAR